MKLVHQQYDDKWTTFKKVYATQSRIERHLISWLEEKLPDWPDKNIDRMMLIITKEITDFAKYHAGKMGNIQINKGPAAHYVGGAVAHNKITLKAPGRFAFFSIYEPIK